jgi:hypothetical protein
MKNNQATVVCIDNWSEFTGPKDEFLVNFNKHNGANQATFIESDCWSMDVHQLPKFNIYMYDGAHDHESRHRVLTHYIDCIQDQFIYIVDDWNWAQVREGTRAAIQELQLQVLYEKEIRLSEEESGYTHDAATWWNGIYMCVLSKQT